jgi:hypothetical protein
MQSLKAWVKRSSDLIKRGQGEEAELFLCESTLIKEENVSYH